MLLSQPAFGRLTFRADGSFSYLANIGFTGTDSFTYIPSIGMLDRRRDAGPTGNGDPQRSVSSFN